MTAAKEEPKKQQLGFSVTIPKEWQPLLHSSLIRVKTPFTGRCLCHALVSGSLVSSYSPR